jgi:HlyD family secretion protein
MNVPIAVRSSDVDVPRNAVVPLSFPDAPVVNHILRAAYWALGLFAAFFGIWAIFAPLNSAAIAQGVLRSDGGGRKVVQHLEGGIIQRIAVKEGQRVKAGQVLVYLDNTASGARDTALQTTYDTLLAQDARLTAERTGSGRVSYPAELVAREKEESVKSIIAASDAVFRARRGAMGEQISILRQRVGQSNAEMASTGAQIGALGSQSRLLEEEARGVQTLVDEGLERKSRLLALQRQQAATNGQQGQLVGNQVRIREAVGETQAQMAFLRSQMVTDAAAQQRDVQASLAEMVEKLNVSRDISKRRQIIAPVDGTVVNLRMVTPGGVVGPGQPILDIVPANEKIVVVARLKANDVDVVYQNLSAEIRLTPYKARTMPMLHGTVREVSPDAIYDDKTNTLYYETQIVLDAKELKELRDVRLVSGMPAEVFINLGSRSLLQYLMQPVLDSFHRAFRES